MTLPSEYTMTLPSECTMTLPSECTMTLPSECTVPVMEFLEREIPRHCASEEWSQRALSIYSYVEGKSVIITGDGYVDLKSFFDVKSDIGMCKFVKFINELMTRRIPAANYLAALKSRDYESVSKSYVRLMMEEFSLEDLVSAHWVHYSFIARHAWLVFSDAELHGHE